MRWEYGKGLEINSEINLPANILQQIEEIMDIEECYNEYIRNLVSDEIENNQEGLKNGL